MVDMEETFHCDLHIEHLKVVHVKDAATGLHANVTAGHLSG